MATITLDQQNAIRTYVTTHKLSAGLGTEESACSIAAINLSLTGELTDVIPACMSEVVGRLILGIQDAMPSDMRNSDAWRLLLPLAAGTGTEKEAERLALVLDWMWTSVLPELSPVALKYGFGQKWQTFLQTITAEAAVATRRAGRHAEWAVWAARDASYAAEAAGAGAMAARAARGAAGGMAYWDSVNPAALLAKLITL